MNRREFFRRTVPAVAVTVAATQSGWTMDFFKRLLSRVLHRCDRIAMEAKWEAAFAKQAAYQAKQAIMAMAQRIAEQMYGNPGLILRATA